jgi:RHH-type transcriptional regulator, rel operon repressor / antitoxin RelB
LTRARITLLSKLKHDTLECVQISTGLHNVSTTMTIRLEPDVKERLGRLAAATDRSKSFLAGEAVRAYVENHEWQIEERIRTAFEEADAEDFCHGKGCLEACAEMEGECALDGYARQLQTSVKKHRLLQLTIPSRRPALSSACSRLRSTT